MSLCLICMTAQWIAAQKTNLFFVEAGPALSTFQDVKFSDVRYQGIGGAIRIGGNIQGEKAIFGYGLKFRIGSESPNTFDKSVTNFQPGLYVQYLRRIHENLAIGAQWDMVDMYIRSIPGLMNNGSYIVTASDLMLQGQLQVRKLSIGLGVGIISYNRENISFAFSAPQNALEDGDFDYQNEALNNPLGLEFFEIQSLNKYLKLRTNFQYQLNDRIGFSYHWEMRRFSTVKDYPTTLGAHRLTVRWNIVYKVKNKLKG